MSVLRNLRYGGISFRMILLIIAAIVILIGILRIALLGDDISYLIGEIFSSTR